MIGFILGFGFGFGLKYALCKYNDKCTCNTINWKKIK
mgnify:FL=1